MPKTTLPSPLVSRLTGDAGDVVGAAVDASVDTGWVDADPVVAGVVEAGCVAAGAATVVAELDLLSPPHAAATTDINASAASVRPAAVPNLRLFTRSPPCVAD